MFRNIIQKITYAGIRMLQRLNKRADVTMEGRQAKVLWVNYILQIYLYYMYTYRFIIPG